MPSRTFQLNPGGNDAYLATTGHNAVVATPDNAHNDDSTRQHAGRGPVGFINQPSMRFDFGRTGGETIPAGATILDARLRLRAGEFIVAGPCPVTVSLVARDGIWDRDYGVSIPAHEWVNIPVHDGGGQLLSTGFATLAGPSFTGAIPVPNEIPLQSQGGAGADSVIRASQTLQATANGTCRFGLVRLRRPSGSNRPVSVILCELYRAAADDGSDDRPTGSALTSGTVSFNSLPTGTAGSMVAFDFSAGGGNVAITSGLRYVLVAEPLIVSSPGPPAASFMSRRDDPYALGSTSIYAIRAAFSTGHYPTRGKLPFLYEADGSTIRDAPHGSTIDLDLPDFTSLGTFFEVTGLESLVQEWIDDPAYAEDETIAVQVSGRAAATAGQERHWDLAELFVEWSTVFQSIKHMSRPGNRVPELYTPANRVLRSRPANRVPPLERPTRSLVTRGSGRPDKDLE